MFLLDALRTKAEAASAGLPGLAMKAEAIASSVIHGEHSKRRAGPGEKFWQFRHYDVSDRPQDIDWKQTAKNEGVFVREKEWQNPQKVMFWSAGGAGMEYSSNPAIPTKHETAIVLSLALALLMTRAGEQVGPLGNRRPGRSEKAMETLGQSLLDSGAGLPDIHGLPLNAGLVLAGDFWDTLEDIETLFKALEGRSRQVLLFHVFDPAEIELPFEGRALFRAPGIGQHDPIRIEHIGDIRARYRARVEGHVKALEELCRRYGFSYFEARTDSEMEGIISRVWEEGRI